MVNNRTGISTDAFALLTAGKVEKLFHDFPKIEIEPFVSALILQNSRRAKTGESNVNAKRRRIDPSVDWLTELRKIRRSNFVSDLVHATSMECVAQKLKLVLASKIEQGVCKLEAPAAGSTTRFERECGEEKVLIVLRELLEVCLYVSRPNTQKSAALRQFELFDTAVYFADICDILIVSLASRDIASAIHELALPHLVEALLRYSKGAAILQRYVANNPHLLHETCELLLQNSSTDPPSSLLADRRHTALQLLCSLDTQLAFRVRRDCLRRLRLPSLYIALGTSATADFSSFATEILAIVQDTTSPQRNWLNKHLRSTEASRANNGSLAVLLKNFLMNEVNRLLQLVPTENDIFPESATTDAQVVLRMYAALRCEAALKLGEDDIKLLTDLICVLVEPSSAASAFISQALAVITCCPVLLSSAAETDKILKWLKWLLHLEHEYELKQGVAHNTFSELLLLITLHLHSAQYTQLATLVGSIVGFSPQMRSNQLHKVKSLFTEEVFSEAMITERVARMAVTDGLSAQVRGYLPIHCVTELLHSRIFTKHKVSIKDWIVRQIAACRTPIHLDMVELLDTYVKTCLTVVGTAMTNKPIDESVICEYFSVADPTRASHLVSRVLLMYYVLLYEEQWIVTCGSLAGSLPSIARLPPRYSPEAVLQKIPIRYLMSRVQGEKNFACIHSPLMRLCLFHFPYLFVVHEPLSCADADDLKGESNCCSVPPCKTDLKELTAQISSDETALRLLHRLEMLDSSALLQCMDTVLSCLPLLLRDDVSDTVRYSIQSLWSRLEQLTPLDLYCQTVAALRAPRPDETYRRARITHSVLCGDPLAVLRCDDRVLRCVPILEVVLRILSVYLAGSRTDFQHQIMCRAGTAPNQQVTSEQEELLRALVGAQSSAAVQILLEACLPITGDGENCDDLSTLREIRCLICSHVHQMFIEDPLLIKLVHFQGYRTEILAVTVPGIPSMHICLDFIHELFAARGDHVKILFGVELLSHLGEQYTIPKTLSAARLGVNVLNTLLTVLPSDSIVLLFNACLSPLERIAKVFPPLSSDIVDMLMQVACVTQSRLSITSERPVHRAVKCQNSPEALLLKRLKVSLSTKLNTSVLYPPFL